MASRVGPKGQVVIPKELRDRLGIGPGSGVEFRLRQDDVLEIRRSWVDPIYEGPRAIQALTRPDAGRRTASDDLLAMRSEDESLWQLQFERWGARRGTPVRSSSTRSPSSRSSTAKPART